MTRFEIRRANFSLMTVGLLIGAGCSSAIDATPVAVVPAEGTLTYRGQPVVEAHLTFRAEGSSEPAFAVTDASGHFRCLTNDTGEGLPPGEYAVTVSSPRDKLPAKYAAIETSPLHVTVEADADNRFPLELED